MGNYNPHQPYILGEEWVPIRDEDTAFSPAVSAVEVGHRFTLTQSRALQDGRFYARDLPVYTGQAFGVDVYPAGLEDQTGPISSVVIPVCAGAITGADITLSNASTVAEAVSSPSDGKSIVFFSTGVFSQVSFFFGTNSYAAPLSGKRILTVNVLYIANGTINAGPDDTLVAVLAYLQRDSPASGKASFYKAFTGTGFTSTQSPGDFIGTLKRARLGDIAYFWGSDTAASTSERAFYTYPVLQQFEAAASNRVHLQLELQTLPLTSEFGTLSYLALEVVYCEEQRSASGARQFGFSPVPTSLGLTNYTEQTNIIPLRSPQSLAINPILTAGSYTAALVSPNLGDAVLDDAVPISIANSDYPTLNALRELYQTPPHPGIQVNVPFPLEDHLGETFTQVETHILPQLSLHASGGTLTEPHAYGRQGQAQVYGVNTATQDIYDDISGVAADYPQVRFYARRFGDTTIPLTLTGVGGLSGSTVNITPGDFDELAEILDGWREVTLRFSTPPSMGTVAGNPAWTWSAATETSGNRWEILSACAPAISGTPCNLYNLVPAPNQLGVATYQPPAGDTVEMTWMPQGVASPYVSGATIDPACDAVLIFSQDPPTITGVSISQESQTVTGLGLDCGSLPCCIPSGIGYQRITWSATSLPSTGFGAYEMQRWDYLDPTGDFQTIMLATSPIVTGFSDYEARVGVTSVYRIRSLNVLNFAGSWSTYVSGTPVAPGVTSGPCDDMNGVLIFSSNADQSGGSNAAYVMQWERDPTEEFSLPEASMVEYQPMYGRDGSVAFHGTERGFETFSRTVLLQAGAISPVALADASTIRDLAWANLPYVCVRDELGDRWLSSVRVPSVSVRHNRTKYMARIDIVEVTATPYPVNP